MQLYDVCIFAKQMLISGTQKRKCDPGIEEALRASIENVGVRGLGKAPSPASGLGLLSLSLGQLLAPGSDARSP